MTFSNGAAKGLKVIDLSRVLGGPFATQILADHGADVIKVEPPQGDEVRDWGPPFHGDDAAYFLGINRNKRALSLDLTNLEGRKVLMALLKDADVLIENFKPGTMEDWGMSYDNLKKQFPKLVYCKISGFGKDGPLGGYPGYDGIVGAMVGHCSVTGSKESGPTRIGMPIVDISTGLYSAIGILLALYERQSSGEGQYFEVTLYDTALTLMHPHFTNFFFSGNVPELTGNQHASIVPYGMFDTKTVPVMVGVGNERAFVKFADTLGRPDLAKDPRFQNNGARQKNRHALNAIIAEQLANVDGEEFALKLLKAGLPCGPVLDTRRAIEAEHTAARGSIYENGWYRGIATPIRLERTPGGFRSVPPRFSEHLQEVMSEHGIEDDEVGKLIASGALVETRRR